MTNIIKFNPRGLPVEAERAIKDIAHGKITNLTLLAKKVLQTESDLDRQLMKLLDHMPVGEKTMLFGELSAPLRGALQTLQPKGLEVFEPWTVPRHLKHKPTGLTFKRWILTERY